jgi:hypothetical protein
MKTQDSMDKTRHLAFQPTWLHTELPNIRALQKLQEK